MKALIFLLAFAAFASAIPPPFLPKCIAGYLHRKYVFATGQVKVERRNLPDIVHGLRIQRTCNRVKQTDSIRRAADRAIQSMRGYAAAKWQGQVVQLICYALKKIYFIKKARRRRHQRKIGRTFCRNSENMLL